MNFLDDEIDKVYSITYPDESKYEGHIIDFLRQGLGILTEVDDSIYCGQWKNDVKHGFGSETLPDKTSHEELWCNGNLIKRFTKDEEDTGLDIVLISTMDKKKGKTSSYGGYAGIVAD